MQKYTIISWVQAPNLASLMQARWMQCICNRPTCQYQVEWTLHPLIQTTKHLYKVIASAHMQSTTLLFRSLHPLIMLPLIQDIQCRFKKATKHTLEFYSTAFQYSSFALFSHQSFTKFDHLVFLIKIPPGFLLSFLLCSCVDIIFCATCLFIMFFILP